MNRAVEMNAPASAITENKYISEVNILDGFVFGILQHGN